MNDILLASDEAADFGLLAHTSSIALDVDSLTQPGLDDVTSLTSLDVGATNCGRTPAASDHAPDGPSTGASSPQQPQCHSRVVNRFSSESVRVLRQWLKDNQAHPYATAHDVDIIQTRTGLTKQQVNNWLSNARRRYKFATPPVSSRLGRALPDSTQPGEAPMDIPRRRPTPVPLEAMNPLERWENSPPEHEPATVSDISRIMAATPATPATPYYLRGSEISSSDASSVSSAGVSRSSRGSGSSSRSGNVADSLGDPSSGRKKRRRFLRRHATRRTNLLQTWHTFQCTFCIETFKHKYDWQRHEKSLHLSLEEWVCTPTGPTALNPDVGVQVCVYCGAAEPDKSHLEAHHHSVCQERTLGHRTFYRKDHLRQHLKLVHDSNFMSWPMEQWKVSTREIRSRCGFCNLQLDTWGGRTDHLAEHFKSGYTMADWKGDWGFEPQVVEIVDNAMPPYLINQERASPFPISSVRGSNDTPTSPYELIKLELEYFTQGCLDTRGSLPSDSDLQYESCSVIFGADMVSPHPAVLAPSWLRDMFLCSDMAEKARLLPLQQIAKSRLSQLKINGKRNVFDDCDLELELCRLVTMHSSIGVVMSDHDLQQEAANIISYVEAFSPRPSKHFADFTLRLVWGSTKWLEQFRERRQQLFMAGSGNAMEHSSVLIDMDPSLNFSGQRITPDLLQEDFSPFNEPGSSLFLSPVVPREAKEAALPALTNIQHSTSDSPSLQQRLLPISANIEPKKLYANGKVPYLLNDHNSYTRLAAGLARFVTTTMSPNNPNRHIPTDEELQYQARWMWYDEDDPWNQTPADNAAWLVEFKRGVGLIPEEPPHESPR